MRPTFSFDTLLQLVLGVSLLNVWLLRAHRTTPYRGGAARSLKEEFAAYGLPDALFYIVGLLKIGAGLVLLGGLWWPLPIVPAAGVVAALMVGAILMHVRIKDPAGKSVPAAVLLLLSTVLIVRQLP